MVSAGRAPGVRSIAALAHTNAPIAIRNQSNPKPAEMLANPAGVGPTSPNGAACLLHVTRVIGRLAQKSDGLTGPENRSNPRPAGMVVNPAGVGPTGLSSAACLAYDRCDRSAVAKSDGLTGPEIRSNPRAAGSLRFLSARGRREVARACAFRDRQGEQGVQGASGLALRGRLDG
jgi:hypothetical protein